MKLACPLKLGFLFVFVLVFLANFLGYNASSENRESLHAFRLDHLEEFSSFLLPGIGRLEKTLVNHFFHCGLLSHNFRIWELKLGVNAPNAMQQESVNMMFFRLECNLHKLVDSISNIKSMETKPLKIIVFFVLQVGHHQVDLADPHQEVQADHPQDSMAGHPQDNMVVHHPLVQEDSHLLVYHHPKVCPHPEAHLEALHHQECKALPHRDLWLHPHNKVALHHPIQALPLHTVVLHIVVLHHINNTLPHTVDHHPLIVGPLPHMEVLLHTVDHRQQASRPLLQVMVDHLLHMSTQHFSQDKVVPRLLGHHQHRRHHR